jgi:DNA repair exonuclease SbcCD nuclease subunit
MISRIYHIADVHLTANQKRKEEYEKVLERTIKTIKNDKKEKLVVICGDLFHEKTRPYQEANVMARNFIKELGEICEVIIISGNHDVNINDETRTDSIEATLCNLTTKYKINHLTENKIYKICGINFGLTKMTNTEVTKIENKNKEEMYIALYHGTLYKSKTDVGYKFEDENKIKTSDFKDYDYAMLGDIHLYQFMNKKKTIAYSGSLVQQNFGENIKNHGILLWNLKTKTSKLIEIENEYVFKTHIINDINDLDIEDIENKKCRLRVQYKNIELNDIIKYEKEIRKKYKIIEFVRDEKTTENINGNEEIIDKTLKKNFMDVYKKFNKIKEIIPDEEELKILKTLVDNENVNIEKVKKGIELEELEFENLVTYGRSNIIKFKKMERINILTGKNGLGKSGIIDIILFILYDKFSKGSGTGKDILNVRYVNGFGTLRLKLNGTKYTIYRKVNKQRSEVYIFKDFLTKKEIDIEVKQIDKNKKDKKAKDKKAKDKKNKSINNDDNASSDDNASDDDNTSNNNICNESKLNIETQIKDMFGLYDEMTLTSIILQIGGNFADIKDEKKKEILIGLMGLNIYDKIKKECEKIKNNYSKNTIIEINNRITEKDYTNEIKNININIKNKDDEIKESETKIKKITKKINIIEETVKNSNIDINQKEKENEIMLLKIKKIIKEKDDIKLNKKSKEELEKNKKKNQNEINELFIKITRCKKQDENELSNKKEELEKEDIILKNNIKEIEIIETKDDMLNLKNKKKEILNCMNEKKILEENLKIHKENNIDLLKHKFNKECKCCKENIKIHENIGYLKKIKTIEKTIKSLKYSEEDLNGINEKIEKNKEINDNKNKLEILILKKQINNDEKKKIIKIIEILNENKIIEEEINKIEEEMNIIESELGKIIKYENIIIEENEIKEKIKDSENEINEYKKNIKDIIKLKEYEIQMEELNEVNNKNKELLRDLIKENGTITKENEIQTKLINESKAIQKKINTYIKILNVYKNGLIEYVMSEKIKILEIKINNILRKLSNYEIKIKIEEKKIIFNKIILTTDDNCRYLNASQLSGYERIVFNLSLRIGLNSMNIMTKNNFLIIDEGFAAADNINIHKFPNILEEIKKEYEICILISHIDEIKNQRGKMIEIEYEEETQDSNIKIM